MASLGRVQAIPAPRLSSSSVSHPFTCNTCQVAFRTSDLQRSHMQSDWHRYNLKRRVASLPPLTSEIFAEKVLATQASAAATAAKASFEKICGPCQRTYFSENAYQNHLGSQKHRLRLEQLSNLQVEDDAASMTSSALSLGEPISKIGPGIYDLDVETEFSEVVNGIKKTTIQDTDFDPVFRRPVRPRHSAAEVREEHPLSPIKSIVSSTPETASVATEVGPRTHDCLFCNFESLTLEANVEHMETSHSLFIPERPFLTDLSGLVEHLQEKVTILHECLFCGHMKQSTHGIKTHMRDKGHCMIAFESEEEMLEVGQFYDFRSSYSDDELEDPADEENTEHRGGVKLGVNRSKVSHIARSNDDEDDIIEDEVWETDESDELNEHDDSDSQNHPTRSTNGAHSATRPETTAFFNDYELHLPSGRTAGHRSLARYYRQNLSSYPTAIERANQLAITNSATSTDGEALEQVLGRGRALAVRNLGMEGVSDLKKREVQAVEVRERKREHRTQAKYQWGNDKRGNQQKHYRDPLLQ